MLPALIVFALQCYFSGLSAFHTVHNGRTVSSWGSPDVAEAGQSYQLDEIAVGIKLIRAGAHTHMRGEHYKQADRGVFKSSGLFLSVRSLSVSHGGANGFYFQDTMLLQSLGLL